MTEATYFYKQLGYTNNPTPSQSISIDEGGLNKDILEYALSDKFKEKMETKTYNLFKNYYDYYYGTKRGGKKITTYKPSKNNKYGRLFGNHTLQGVWRDLRNAVINKKWIDIDIKNCHPVILLQITNKMGWKNDKLKEYVNNRDSILKEVMNEYKCDREKAKNLFIRIMYGGEAENWVKDIGAKKIIPFVKEFNDEMREINKNHYNTNEFMKNVFLKSNDKADVKNPDRSAIAYCLQTIENEILMKTKEYFDSTRKFIVKMLCFDGLMIEDINNKAKDNLNLQELNDYIKKTTPWDVEFTIKEPTDLLFNWEKEKKEFYAKKENIYRLIKIINGGPLSLIRELETHLNENIIFCNQEWFIYNNNTGLWSKEDNPYSFFIDLVNKSINEEIDKLNYMGEDQTIKEACKELEKLKITIDKPGFKNMVKDHLKNVVKDNDFYQKLNNLVGKLVFKNGIFNLQTGKFDEGFLREDYITDTLPYEFTDEFNEKDEKFIYDKLLEICNNKEKDRDTFLRILGYALTGLSSNEQNFYLCYGPTAGNGKTLIFETIDEILPIYSKKIDNQTFNKDYSKAHKELIQLSNKRFIWCDEIPKKKLNNDLLKEVANGSKISIEKLYSTNVEVNLNCKLFITSNNSLNIDSDEGTVRRLIQLNFKSKFYENEKIKNLNPNNVPAERCFIMDCYLKNKFIERKNSFIKILCKYAKMYYDEGLNLPQEVLQNSRESINDDDDIKQLFTDGYLTLEQEAITHKDELIDFLHFRTSQKFNLKMVKDLMNKYSVSYDRDRRKKINGVSKRGVFIGLKIEE